MHKSLNQLNYLLVPLMLLITVSFGKNWRYYLALILLALVNLMVINRRPAWKKLIYFSLILIPTLATGYLTAVIFKSSANVNDLNMIGLNFSIRLYALAIVSFIFISNMPRQEIMLDLMQRRILPVTIGFGLLVSLNAFSNFAKEFKRIQLAYQMRFGRKLYSPRIALPLLITATRYAQSASISMFNRGLNQQRSYHRTLQPINYLDYALWLINGLLVTLIWCFLN